MARGPFTEMSTVRPIGAAHFGVLIVPVDQGAVKAQFEAPDLAHLRPARGRCVGRCPAFTHTIASRSAADVTDRVVNAVDAGSTNVRNCIDSSG